MHPEAERELTHILLVELLAHQFTYPVRWIETQNAILGEIGAERIVEIGPSNILTNMMKRTLQDKFHEEDLSRGVIRRILGPQGDHTEIYYLQSEDSVVEEPAEHTASLDTNGKDHESVPPPFLAKIDETLPNQPISHAAPAEVPDVEAPVSSIVMAIVATKLKKKPSDISMSSTISSLVGGRSTLTNEIIGDLHKEFSDKLPDKAEEVALENLCETLSTQHSGRLGKQVESIVSRMISSKFPPDHAQSNIRQILHDQWGLGPMRQDALLLLAVSQQPESRLSSSEAQKFLSSLAAAYFQQQGLPLPSSSSPSTQGATAMVDTKTLQAMNEKNSALAREILGVLKHHLQGTGPETVSETNDEAGTDAVRLLDIWVTEHGEDYADGIMPKFNIKKQRIFDSYWNWNAQDISILSELCRDPEVEKNVILIRQLSDSIMNRACDRSNAQIRYLLAKEKRAGKEETAICKSMQFLYEACLVSKDRDPVFTYRSVDMAPLTIVDANGRLRYQEIARNPNPPKSMKLPSLSVSSFRNGVPAYSHEHTISYAFDLKTMKDSGLSLRGKNVLLNGAGKRSIGIHILRYLLEAGARVTLTTSSYSPETNQKYQEIYARYGARDSVLRVLPYNQGSNRDVQNLVQYLDSDPSWDLDFIIPFAAVSENGRGLEDLDSKSEIAHRLMLTNLLRLLGGIARSKRSKNITTRPATVLLPLSPNHGLMGNDGLYSESKRSLEVLLAKWSSESWREYLSFFGVIIGWTRGTGLMSENDMVSQAVEALGVRTYAADEMAANIVCMMGGSLNAECQAGPLLVDIGGGLGKVDDFKEKLTAIRRDLNEYAEVRRALEEERRLEEACVNGKTASSNTLQESRPSIRANLRLPLPMLPDYDTEIAPLASSLEGMVDLSRVVVITGFSELGPYGSSRTRWEIEANGTLSLEGCIEMAWMMGLIKHNSGVNKDGSKFSGWVDTKTMLPVDDADVPSRYMLTILEHTGIRVIEPEICDNGYDPEHKESMQELLLQRDLPPFEASVEMASDLQRQHGNKAVVTTEPSGTCHIQLKAGATIMIPRASHFDRTVAGQIPTGWSPKRYGISDDIIEQVDPVTLFSLVCTVEALLCSGITDPYELYKHIHVSEVGNCMGSSMGGLSSLRKMHRERFIDKSVKGDILQETFINTTGAWINMLLTSSSGPIRTPVGACATSLESLDTGYDLIVAKKAKICLVGGVEDFVEDVSFEFGSMKATCNTDAEFAAGRSPREMSRPTASTRSGFVESQGCGIQVLTSAELAMQMGLPIFGVVAYTSMAADKASRSVPAPGKGVLTNARELHSMSKQLRLPLLDLNHRRKLLGLRKKQIADWRANSTALIYDELLTKDLTEEERNQYYQESVADIEMEARKQLAEATFNLGNQFWKEDREQRISPIRGSLAVFGLDVDDISVASLHGTSTVQNDLNETLVIEEQMRHLGRRDGNLLPCVCQKWLTGHSKGAAGAWMLNGCLQMMDSGLVPGNRNADNVDEKLRARRHLQFPGVTLDTCGSEGIKACSVTSFGFGQKGAQAILVHPRYLYATASAQSFREYSKKMDTRWRLACRTFSEAMVNENMVSRCIKSQPPYSPSEEMAALLDPSARF
ncbi:thiolase-like protein [Xylariaceae sp. FL1651]|nr:thiolase-like protein [Xylariaceae sp. FL1651]